MANERQAILLPWPQLTRTRLESVLRHRRAWINRGSRHIVATFAQEDVLENNEGVGTPTYAAASRNMPTRQLRSLSATITTDAMSDADIDGAVRRNWHRERHAVIVLTIIPLLTSGLNNSGVEK